MLHTPDRTSEALLLDQGTNNLQVQWAAENSREYRTCCDISYSSAAEHSLLQVPIAYDDRRVALEAVQMSSFGNLVDPKKL